MEQKITEARCLWSGVIGTIGALFIFMVSGRREIGSRIGINNNIAALFAACAAFAIITLASYGILCLCKAKLCAAKNLLPKYVYAAITAVTIVLTYGMLRQDDGYSGADVTGFWWHIIPAGIVMAVLISASAAGIYLVYTGRREKTVNRLLLYVFFAAAAVIYAGTVVYLNVYAGDLYHIDAYVHPIYNVYYNTPYSDVSYGIYGHYELFYKIPMLIFGTSPRVICIMLLVIAFAEAMILFYIVDQLVISRVIKLMVPLALAVPTGCMFLSSSYQSTPHRIIFPMILLLYAVRLEKGGRAVTLAKMLKGHMICAAAVLWNTETGLICCIAWSAYILIHSLLQQRIDWKLFAVRTVQTAAMTVLDIALAIMVVNIYNICVGGAFILRQFFYPFVNGGFMHHYSIRLQFGNRPYVYILILCFGAITYGLSRTTLFTRGRGKTGYEAVIFLSGLLLLGQLTYYMTRAAYYGLLITYPFVMILMAYFADFFSRREKSQSASYTLTTAVKGGIAGTQIAALTILVLLAGGLFEGYADSFEMGRYSRDTADEALAEIEREVVPDTYAVGWGVDEIYGDLGWNAQYHMLGTTDVLVDIEANSGVYEQLVREANEQELLFLNTNAYSIVQQDYELIKEYVVCGQTYGYFKKVEES